MSIGGGRLRHSLTIQQLDPAAATDAVGTLRGGARSVPSRVSDRVAAGYAVGQFGPEIALAFEALLCDLTWTLQSYVPADELPP